MPRLREFRWGQWAEAAVRQHNADRPSLIAIDTETTGVGFNDTPFGATVTWRRFDLDRSMTSWYFELDTDTTWAPFNALQQILLETPAWVGHNLKFDLQKLMLSGVLNRDEIGRHELHDTQTQYHLLDENDRKGLKYLAVKVLGYDDTIEVEIKSGPNKGKTRKVPKEEHRLAEARRKLKLKKEDGYHLLPRPVVVPYALKDTEFTLALHEVLLPKVEERGLLDWYRTEIDLQLALLDMEADGLLLDLEYLNRVASEYGARAMEQWQDVVALTGNADLNLNSPRQLLQAFAARGHRLESTDAATLKKLDDDLARAILAYRETFKLHKTYLKGLQDEHRDGLVHPSFNPTGARTGRLSSGSAKE